MAQKRFLIGIAAVAVASLWDTSVLAQTVWHVDDTSSVGTEFGTLVDPELDCNENGTPDFIDIPGGTSEDCNSNKIPDECEIDENSSAPGGPFFCISDCDPDCNTNGVPDACDVTGGHDCCEFSHGPGCSNSAIRACVCAVDPYCCDVDWDRLCVQEVASEGCGDCEVTNDCNGNGLLDECEVLGTGDYDGDGDVDLEDNSALVGCMAGPGAPPAPPLPECAEVCLAAFDSDEDDDVDLADFTQFQEAFTG